MQTSKQDNKNSLKAFYRAISNPQSSIVNCNKIPLDMEFSIYFRDSQCIYPRHIKFMCVAGTMTIFPLFFPLIFCHSSYETNFGVYPSFRGTLETNFNTNLPTIVFAFSSGKWKSCVNSLCLPSILINSTKQDEVK